MKLAGTHFLFHFDDEVVHFLIHIFFEPLILVHQLREIDLFDHASVLSCVFLGKLQFF